MKNILVTGGAGFIGSNFIRYLLKVEPDVRIVNLDSLTYAGSMENLKDLPDPDRHVFVHGEVCDSKKTVEIFREYQIDTVVHFAAESHVDRSIIDPGQFIQTNVVGTYTLLETARDIWLNEKLVPREKARFHHISTDEVFGSLEPDEPAWTEETPYSPNSPYAASKAAADQLVRAYGHTYGLPYTITNCTNNYGPYQFPEKLIPLMILNAIEGHHLPVYGDGKQIRDWLFVEDHCKAVWLVLQKGRIGETYNIGGNNQPNNLEVLTMLCEILDKLLPESSNVPHNKLIKFVKDRPGHDRRYAMDSTKIIKELGWRPRYSLTGGFTRTVKWYLDNPQWVSAIRKQSRYQQWLDINYAKREEK